jgi:hypothetical protein
MWLLLSTLQFAITSKVMHKANNDAAIQKISQAVAVPMNTTCKSGTVWKFHRIAEPLYSPGLGVQLKQTQNVSTHRTLERSLYIGPCK